MRHRGTPAAARHRASPPEEGSLTGPSPRFLGSFPRADVPLDPPLPEIALLGRSNVGKSSLLNALIGRRIAKVSGTPGKTRMMNVYLIPVSGAWDVVSGTTPASKAHASRTTDRALYFLDLPGYGYARAAKADRAALRGLVHDALGRPGLTGIVWLLDIRREPSADDGAVQDALAAARTPVLAAITKSDKLPRGQRLRRERELRAAAGVDADQVVVTSARTGEGIAELREAIGELVSKATE